MKKRIILLLAGSTFFTSSIFAQVYTANVVEAPCEGYELTINDLAFEKTDSCEHEIAVGFASDGEVVTIKAVDKPLSSLNGVSTLDLVIMTKIMLGENVSGSIPVHNEGVYKSDIDQDGAVSTYDIVQMRAIILGVESDFPSPNRHLIEASTVVPELDPFDIQVDYSQLMINYQSSTNSVNLRVLKLGDVSNNGI